VAKSLQSKKRAKQNTKRRTINRARKSQVKTQIKHLETTMDKGDVEARAAQARHKEAGQNSLDKHNAQENRLPKEITLNQTSERPEGKKGLIISDIVKRQVSSVMEGTKRKFLLLFGG